MAIKHVVTRMLDPESIVTHGFNYIGPHIIAMTRPANHLVGDLLNDEVYYRTVPLTGFTFSMLSRTTGAAITSGTVNGFITKDGASQAALGGTPVHEGNGQWSVDVTTSEMDAEVVALVFTHSSGIPTYVTIETNPV